MKLLILCCFIASLPLYAVEKAKPLLGGVDVGNGMIINSGFELSRSFDSEEELVDYFNLIKEDVTKGKFKTVEALTRLGDCQRDKVKFNRLYWDNYYPSEGKRLLNRKYKGIVNIGLYNCKRPTIVEASSSDDRGR